jgi:hypothetical protein
MPFLVTRAAIWSVSEEIKWTLSDRDYMMGALLMLAITPMGLIFSLIELIFIMPARSFMRHRGTVAPASDGWRRGRPSRRRVMRF